MAYEKIKSLIPHTSMHKYFNKNGEFIAYMITPETGYVLHDKMYDTHYRESPESEEIYLKGYQTKDASCSTNYDFDKISYVDGYEAYGVREFFTVPASEVEESDKGVIL